MDLPPAVELDLALARQVDDVLTSRGRVPVVREGRRLAAKLQPRDIHDFRKLLVRSICLQGDLELLYFGLAVRSGVQASDLERRPSGGGERLPCHPPGATDH